MKNEIVKINASDYGLDETRANELIKNLPQIITERDAFVSQFDEVIRLDIEDPVTSIKARDLRLKIRDNRTKGIEVWHKTTKDYFLKGGQFVDAIKRKEIAVNERMEDDLDKIEKYQENREKELKEQLKNDRAALISPYVEDVNTFMLGEMTEDAFNKLLAGAKLQYDMRVEAEKKAEEERIAKEKADAAERERVRLENERLIKEAEEREKQIAAEREAAKKEQEKKDALLKKEREKADVERKALEDKAKKEREEREKLEAEIKAKEDAKKKADEAEKRRIAAEEKKAKLAPDKTKLLNFMQAINDLSRPEVKSIEAADIASKANIMLVQVANYIRDNANKL
ncbi:MAG: hypothetical protein WC302_03560 [Candidatus Paceibacterota bacterium]|jgi:hypothetical protein